MDAETVRQQGTLVATSKHSGSKLYSYDGGMWRIYEKGNDRFAYRVGNDNPKDRKWAFSQWDSPVKHADRKWCKRA